MNNIKQMAKQSRTGFVAGRIKCTYVTVYDKYGTPLFSFNKPKGVGTINAPAPIVTKGEITDTGMLKCQLSTEGYNAFQNVVGDKGEGGKYGKMISEMFRKTVKDAREKLLPIAAHKIDVYVNPWTIEPEPATQEEVPAQPLSDWWMLVAGGALLLLNR